jgi:RHS repeat-associated protein
LPRARARAKIASREKFALYTQFTSKNLRQVLEATRKNALAYDKVASGGRYLSIDPVTTDANTGSSFNRYAYAANNPYKYIDPDGREIVIGGSDSYKKAVTADIAKISSGKNGNKLIATAEKGISKTIVITESKSANSTGYADVAGASKPGQGSNSVIEYNPSSTEGGKDASGSNSRPAFVGLSHELGHAVAAAKPRRRATCSKAWPMPRRFT